MIPDLQNISPFAIYWTAGLGVFVYVYSDLLNRPKTKRVARRAFPVLGLLPPFVFSWVNLSETGITALSSWELAVVVSMCLSMVRKAAQIEVAPEMRMMVRLIVLFALLAIVGMASMFLGQMVLAAIVLSVAAGIGLYVAVKNADKIQ